MMARAGLALLAALCALLVCAYTIEVDKTEGMETAYQVSSVRPNDQIIAVAKTQLGAPYGHGPGAWTCSEYTRYVIGRATGTWISSTPSGQLSSGWQPRKTKRGDILFYDESGRGISHVAIYMGKGKIIHASNYFMDVHISYSMYLEYAYVASRRIR